MNYKWHIISVFLLLACFFLALFEPYGLRLRHIISGWVYTHRVFERERWLYTHILVTRDGFLTFAKKAIQDKVGFGRRKNWRNRKSRFQVSWKERLVHRFPILLNFFDPTTLKCFVCGARGHHDDRETFIDCLECKTMYCVECMKDMGDQCVICSNSMDSSESGWSDSVTSVEQEESFPESNVSQDKFSEETRHLLA